MNSAPCAQLILYPKYPEVRFSGFLNKVENPPSELMTQRLLNRLLFLGVTKEGNTIGYVSHPDSQVSNEFFQIPNIEEIGVFKVLNILIDQNNKERLLNELKRIHNLQWIESKRLDRAGNLHPCISSNCGGYTLEAELGITPNGFSEPDFFGWEIKQFGVRSFNHLNNPVITLMTPEPTGGVYTSKGVEFFIRNYGYPDLLGRNDRLNFGGIHKADETHFRTNLKLVLVGFDGSSGKITDTGGCIALIDKKDNEVATWSFLSLIKHWNKKHNQACYVPSLSRKNGIRYYYFGKTILLGFGTDFQFFLKQMKIGNIYYDPGIKMENASNVFKIKRRSQFRIKAGNLKSLYKNHEVIDLTV